VPRSDWVIRGLDPVAQSGVPTLVRQCCAIQALQLSGAHARGRPRGGGGEVGQTGGKLPHF